MARAGALGGGGLNPFGGVGVSFSAFDVVGTNRESELILTRVEIAWNAGQASDAAYLAALEAYAKTLDPNTSARLNADARVGNVRYTVERQVLSAQVDAGTKKTTDLLAYDKGKLTGLSQDSQEYRQRLNTYQNTQSTYYGELEKDVVAAYNKGQMTTAQLAAWYRARGIDRNLAGNPDITKAIGQRLDELGTRLTSEADSKVLSDYSAGKLAPASFISYATHARARYVPGSTDYRDWTTRINDAHDKSLETALLYRYNLSQQYAQLAKFVASSSAPAGGTSTSKSTRTVLGADGQWHTVTTSSTKATAPSKSEVAAYAKRQIEVADAKREMAQISNKVSGVGGFASTNTVIGYYTNQRNKFAKGSDEWYAIQGKLDSLNDTLHQEQVLASEGVRISYPGGTVGSSSGGGGGGGSTGSSGGSSSAVHRPSDTAGTTIEQFMAAEAKVESGGRYTARNSSSGAYGKYQIMPANWPSWAKKWLGDANAPQTPANQEAVARGKFLELYHWLGDWRAVAHWWLTGNGSKDPGTWSSSSTHYVNMVMAGLGKGPVSSSSLAANAAAAPATSAYGGSSVASNGVKVPVASAARYQAKTSGPPAGGKRTDTGNVVVGGKGPLTVITGESQQPTYISGGRPAGTPETILTLRRTGFPTGLDSSAFAKFYAQYSAAFQSGATEFSIDTGSGVVHYFVGDDPAERRDAMRSLDGLRISLYKTKMTDYAGSPSEITAANQFDGAVEDAAKHELMILDTNPKKGAKQALNQTPEQAPNPIAQGLGVLDTTTSAINDHLKLANEALKRGDLSMAYGQYQLAAAVAATAQTTLARFAAAGSNDISAIEHAFGVQSDEALGTSSSAALHTDLTRLSGFGVELKKALDAGDETLTTLNQIVAKDPQGHPVFDHSSADGQLLLSPGYHWELQGSGEVKPVQTPATGYDPTTGQVQHDLKDMVRIDYVNGGTQISAFAKYTTGTVGYIEQVDGTRIPIMGKVFTRRKADGTDEMWVENPFRPGQWSSSPIAYKAPAGFAAVAGPNGATVFQFKGATDAVTPAAQRAGGGLGGSASTYNLQWDPATGTYLLFRTTPGGMFGQDKVDEPLGSLTDGSFAANAFDNSGFARDMSSLTSDQRALSSLGSPWVGGTAVQRQQWLGHQQSPFQSGVALMSARTDGRAPSLIASDKVATNNAYGAFVAGTPWATSAPVLSARTDGRAPSAYVPPNPANSAQGAFAASGQTWAAAPLTPLPKPSTYGGPVIIKPPATNNAAAARAHAAHEAHVAHLKALADATAARRQAAAVAAAKKSRAIGASRPGLTGTHPGGGGPQEF